MTTEMFEYDSHLVMFLPPGVSVIKLFTDVSYEFSQKARVLVLDKPFQLSLMFVDKAGGYLIVDQLKCTPLG
jgi:hypothetical protein